MSTTGYTIAHLQKALAFAKAHPDGTLRISWAPWPTNLGMSSAEWLSWFQQCLMAKINRQEPACRGRKDNRDWFMQQWRASRELNQPRLVIDWLPKELKTRFAHRLRSNRNDL